MTFRFNLIFCATLVGFVCQSALGQVVVDSVTLQGQVEVTNNAAQVFTDSFLVNDFDNSDAVQIATEFLMPLPEFHSSSLTVEATRVGDEFQVFASGLAEVNFNIFQEDLSVGGIAEASGSATIDFTLDAPYLFSLSGPSVQPVAPSGDFFSTSTVSLTRVDSGSLIDSLSDSLLLPGSYRFLTTVDLTVSPNAIVLDSPPSFIGEAQGQVFEAPNLSLTAVPEPSASVLTGLITGLGFFRRRRP